MPANNEELVNVDRAFQNAWIVYMNGIEVPAISVNINFGIWQIPEAQISLVPDVSLNRLGAEDRLAVQVFYCDHWQTPDNPQFRLLFDGEIVGWSYVNTQRGRSISFSCVDYSQIFTQLFFFFMSSIQDIATGAIDSSVGVNINGVETAGFAPLYPYSLFAQGLIAPESELTGTDADSSIRATPVVPLITRPIDYLYNVIIGLTGAKVPRKSVPASAFFAPWMQRTNFNRRFIALPQLESSDSPGIFPILRAVQSSYAIAAVSQLATDVGSAGSIWSVLQTVYKTLMMEIVMLPTPAAYLSTLPELDIKGPPRQHNGQGSRDTTVLGNYFVKPNLFFGLPPACNIFFPSMINSFQYQENYITQPTRTYIADQTMIDFLSDDQTDAALINLIRAKTSTAHPEEVYRLLVEQQNSKSATVANHRNMLVYPEEFYKGPVVDRRAMPRWFYYLAHAQADQIKEAKKRKAVDTRESVGGNEDNLLYRKYAAYEFFKERYARRTGALSMAFNPYPVPGFPCMVFDRRSTKLDVFGYVTNVTQSLTTRSCSTQLGFSYGRTVQEVFDLLVRQFSAEKAIVDETWQKNRTNVFDFDFDYLRDSAELVGAMAVAPAEPILEIRDVIQNPAKAESFYRSLFFRGKDVNLKLTTVDEEAEGIRAATLGIGIDGVLERGPVVDDEAEGIRNVTVGAPETHSIGDTTTSFNASPGREDTAKKQTGLS